MDLHNEIKHFGEGQMFTKVNMCYYWHNRIKEQNIVIHACKQCQLVKKTINIRFDAKKIETNVGSFPQDCS